MTTGYILLDAPNHAQPQGTFPRRGGARLSGTCIVHTSEGAWTAGVDSLTRLVRTRADYGCYHQACDWEDIARYYPWEWETWQDTETNNWAVGIAAACRTSDWGNMPADVEEGYYRNLGVMAAEFVAYMRDTHGVTVPLRRITGAQARARVPGFAAHGDSGVGRTDPGANFNWAKFFAYAAQALTGTITAQSAPEPTKEWYEMPIPKADLDKISTAVWQLAGIEGEAGQKQTMWRTVVDLAKESRQNTATIAGLTRALSVGSGLTEDQITEAVKAAFVELVKE